MKSLKKIATVFALSGTFAVQSFASVNEVNADMVFEQDSTPVQAVALSSQEMKDTQGALTIIPVLVGAGLSGFSYTLSSSMNNSFTYTGLARATLIGAATSITFGGLRNGLTAAKTVWNVNRSIVTGSVLGVDNATSQARMRAIEAGRRAVDNLRRAGRL